MIRRRIIVAVMALLLAGVSMADETPTTVEDKAKAMIIPRVKMEKLPVEDAIERFRMYGRALDPDGSGINIVFLPPKPKNGARYAAPGETSGITVTMEFVDIPVSEAIRYMCAATGLNYRAESHAFLIWADESYAPDMSLRIYDIPPGVFYSGSTRRHPDDVPDPQFLDDDDFRTMYEEMGILFRSRAWIHYDVTNERLIAFNEPRELHRIGRILDEIIRQPSKIAISATVIDVELPSDAASATADTVRYADIMARPASDRRVLYRANQYLPADGAVAFHDLQTSTIDGELGRLSHDGTVQMSIREDNYTMDIAVDWNERFSASGDAGDLRHAASITTSLLLYDQETAVYPLQTRRENGVTRRLYLLLTPEIIRLQGGSMRPRDTTYPETAP